MDHWPFLVTALHFRLAFWHHLHFTPYHLGHHPLRWVDRAGPLSTAWAHLTADSDVTAFIDGHITMVTGTVARPHCNCRECTCNRQELVDTVSVLKVAHILACTKGLKCVQQSLEHTITHYVSVKLKTVYICDYSLFWTKFRKLNRYFFRITLFRLPSTFCL